MDGNLKSQKTVVKNASCWASPGCHNRCRIAVEVTDGVITKVKAHTHTGAQGIGLTNQGHGCADRMPLFTKWLYDDRQLKYPLKRVGQRGQNRWERISWDQAMDEISHKLK